MGQERTIEINVKTGKAEKNVDNLNKKVGETDGAIGDLTGAVDRLTGGLVTGFQKGVSGIKKGITAMKSLKTAIAATGIGALVVALGAIVTYFTKTQRGADLLSKATKGLGAAFDVIVDRISAIGERLIKLFSDPQQALKDFGNLLKQNIQNRIEGMLELLPALGRAIGLALKGQFREAATTAANAAGKVALGVENVTEKTQGLIDATKDIVEEISKETKAAVDLEKAQQALERREIGLIKTRAQSRAEIEALRLKAADEAYSTEERAAALEKAIEIEKNLANQEIAVAQERARIIAERNALGESMLEDEQAQAEAEARVIELQAQRDTRLKELVGTYNALNNQLDANSEKTRENLKAQQEADEAYMVELLGKYDAILESAQDARNQEVNATLDKYNELLANAEQYGFDEVELNRLKNAELAKINKKYDEEDSARKKKKAEDDLAVQLATADAIANTMGALSQLAGQETATGKALSAAQAVINTYTGATKALAQGGIIGPIAAAGVIATGIASIRQIYATEVPSTSSGGVSVSGRTLGGSTGGSRTSVSTPSIPRDTTGASPRINLNTAGADLGNQIAQSLQGQPMRAYVVNQDIQSADKLNRKIESTATIG
jgi:hypothetical protein